MEVALVLKEKLAIKESEKGGNRKVRRKAMAG
jgi:hypothetical protein